MAVKNVITLIQQERDVEYTQSSDHTYNMQNVLVNTYNGTTDEDTIIVKGYCQSDEFLRTIIKYHNPKDANGKRRFMSHCFVITGGNLPDNTQHTFIVTDAVLNQFPTLEQKIDITRQAIDFFHNHIAKDENHIPNVCFLNYSGHFNIKNPTACNCLLLQHACEQLKLKAKFFSSQLDFALSHTTQEIKGNGNTPGLADIIIVNDINEGNSIMKSFLLNGWKCFGYVLGLKETIILNSRSNIHQNLEAIDFISK